MSKDTRIVSSAITYEESIAFLETLEDGEFNWTESEDSQELASDGQIILGLVLGVLIMLAGIPFASMPLSGIPLSEILVVAGGVIFLLALRSAVVFLRELSEFLH